MFTNIIWATDGSEYSDRALDYAIQMAQRERTGLHVVHVDEKLVGVRMAGMDARVDEGEIVSNIKYQAAAIEAQNGINTTVHISAANTGAVAERIAEVARDTGADLIIVGTRGRSALAGALLGSVTQRLLHLAACPVLAVPPLRPTLPTVEPDKAATAD